MINNLLPFLLSKDINILLLSKDISKLGNKVIDQLETKDAVTDFLRKIGEMLYEILKLINDSLEKAFTLVLNFDFSGISQLQIAGTRLQDFAMTIGFVVFIVFVLVKFLKMESLIGYFYNVLCTLALIAIFGFVFTFMHNLQDYGMKTVKYAFGVQENETTSDMLYRNSTVDLKQSVNKNKVVKLNGKINKRSYNYLESLPRSVIDTKYEDGKVVDLDSGILGTSFMEQKYYRYKTDYWQVVITLIVMAIIYSFSIYKGAYLAVQGQLLKLIGTIAMAIKLHDVKQASQAISSVVNNVLAIFILYLSVTLFSVLNANLITTHYFDSLGAGAWFVKAVFIFACGMMCILGGTEIDKLFGIDSGSGFMLKSAFFGGKMLRGGKNIGRNIGNLKKAGMDLASKGSATADKFSNFANDRVQASMARREKEARTAFAQDAVKGMYATADKPSLNDNESKYERLTDSNTVGSTLKDDEKIYVDENGMAMRHDHDPNANSLHDEMWNKFEDKKVLEKDMNKKYPDEKQIDVRNRPIQKQDMSTKSEGMTQKGMDNKVKEYQKKKPNPISKNNLNQKFTDEKDKKLPEWYHNEEQQRNLVNTDDFDEERLMRSIASLNTGSSVDKEYSNEKEFFSALEKYGSYPNAVKANMWSDYQSGKSMQEIIHGSSNDESISNVSTRQLDNSVTNSVGSNDQFVQKNNVYESIKGNEILSKHQGGDRITNPSTKQIKTVTKENGILSNHQGVVKTINNEKREFGKQNQTISSNIGNRTIAEKSKTVFKQETIKAGTKKHENHIDHKMSKESNPTRKNVEFNSKQGQFIESHKNDSKVSNGFKILNESNRRTTYNDFTQELKKEEFIEDDGIEFEADYKTHVKNDKRRGR